MLLFSLLFCEYFTCITIFDIMEGVLIFFFAYFFCCLQVSNNCMRKMPHHQSTKAYPCRDIAWSVTEEGSKCCHNATSLHNIISKKIFTHHVEQLDPLIEPNLGVLIEIT